MFFLEKSWSWFLSSWNQYLYLQGLQTSRGKSVTEINATSSAWSSIQYPLVRNVTLHKDFRMKTHLFHSRTQRRCGHVFDMFSITKCHENYSNHLNNLQSIPSSNNALGGSMTICKLQTSLEVTQKYTSSNRIKRTTSKNTKGFNIRMSLNKTLQVIQ